MRFSIIEKIRVPEGVDCEYNSGILKCNKNSKVIERKLNLPQIEIKIQNSEIILECKKGNKNHYKKIKSTISHINNLFLGLEEKFVYKLESCNVHFPTTLKVESGKLAITNFLGEKTPRFAKLLPNVEVEVKGNQIMLYSHDREAAGQTAANIERATKIKAKDRRVYQDGIFITSKPGGKS